MENKPLETTKFTIKVLILIIMEDTHGGTKFGNVCKPTWPS